VFQAPSGKASALLAWMHGMAVDPAAVLFIAGLPGVGQGSDLIKDEQAAGCCRKRFLLCAGVL
jgi:hypothetical protein